MKASKTDVFVRRDKTKKKVSGYAIAQTLRLKNTTGDIGIEIEVEGNKFYKDNLEKYWNYHKDGSLRGQDNAEYVLKKPIKFEEVPDAIRYLWKHFESYGSVLDNSNRTSVHVHLNAQKWHLNRLTAFIAMYLSVEEILTEWCGDHRVGNLFCLRAKDAPNIVTQIKRFIRANGEVRISEGMHYAGLNVEALFKFGSLEIRALRGVDDPKLILNWVSILERMYRLSEEYTDPRTLVDSFSGQGSNEYLNMVLGEQVNTVRSEIGFNDQQIQTSLYEGIRLAQDLCYCVDWELFDPVKVEPDPFQRDIRKVLQNMEGYAAGAGSPTPDNPAAELAQSYLGTITTNGSAGNLVWHTATTNAPAPPPAPAPTQVQPNFTGWDADEINFWFETGNYPEWHDNYNGWNDDEDSEPDF